MENENDLRAEIAAKAHSDGHYAIAYALLKLTDAHESMATHLKNLGVGDAATPMGAIEFLASEVKEVADALANIASSIDEKS